MRCSLLGGDSGVLRALPLSFGVLVGAGFQVYVSKAATRDEAITTYAHEAITTYSTHEDAPRCLRPAG